MFDRDDGHFERMRKAIADRPAKSGLDRTLLEAGDVVTFSRNKVTGDRSYIDGVWEVLATNGCQIMLRHVGGGIRWNDKQVMLMLDEHEFYDGRPFLTQGQPA